MRQFARLSSRLLTKAAALRSDCNSCFLCIYANDCLDVAHSKFDCVASGFLKRTLNNMDSVKTTLRLKRLKYTCGIGGLLANDIVTTAERT